MKKYFNQVKKLNKTDNCGIEFAFCKLFEECGELTQSCNKLIGRKVSTQTPSEIKAEIAQECIDVIQNIFCMADKNGNKYKDFNYDFNKAYYDKVLRDRHGYEWALTSLAVQLGSIANCINSIDKSHLKYKCVAMINVVLYIAKKQKISFEELTAQFELKNKKWAKRIKNKEIKTIK